MVKHESAPDRKAAQRSDQIMSCGRGGPCLVLYG